jgi:predicted ester cyclase
VDCWVCRPSEQLHEPTWQRRATPRAARISHLNLDDQVQRLIGFRTAFPDIQIAVEEVIAEGDHIAFRSTMRGTHNGELLGIAPTGKQVAVGLIDVIRVKDGKFAEQWGGPDLFDLLRQLGVVFSVATERNHHNRYQVLDRLHRQVT